MEGILECHLAPGPEQLIHGKLWLSRLKRIIVDMPVLFEREIVQVPVQRLEPRLDDLMIKLPSARPLSEYRKAHRNIILVHSPPLLQLPDARLGDPHLCLPHTLRSAKVTYMALLMPKLGAYHPELLLLLGLHIVLDQRLVPTLILVHMILGRALPDFVTLAEDDLWAVHKVHNLHNGIPIKRLFVRIDEVEPVPPVPLALLELGRLGAWTVGRAALARAGRLDKVRPDAFDLDAGTEQVGCVKRLVPDDLVFVEKRVHDRLFLRSLMRVGVETRDTTFDTERLRFARAPHILRRLRVHV